MSLLTTFSVLTRHASRMRPVCAPLAAVAGYAYFGYWFSRMRA
jgi:hypothetical protein